jgi:hypothetical protein
MRPRRPGQFIVTAIHLNKVTYRLMTYLSPEKVIFIQSNYKSLELK